MSQTIIAAIDVMQATLRDPQKGLNAQLALINARDGVELDLFDYDNCFVFGNVMTDELERSTDECLPRIKIYPRVTDNKKTAAGRAKFQKFGGTHDIGVSVEITDGTLTSLQANLMRYCEAIAEAVWAQRSSLAGPSGLYSDTGYTVEYGSPEFGEEVWYQEAIFTFTFGQFVS